ncbi:MAG: anti-anti-sigma factor [Phycisphaerales bacterium]|nr:anti-anti-sigma factor [Phycisphaerales bacterium]
MNPYFTTANDADGHTVVRFVTESLMNQSDIEAAGAALCRLAAGPGPHRLVLDLALVRHLSSQAIGILVRLNKQVGTVPGSTLVLCGVYPPLTDLLRITRLDKVFVVRPTRDAALRAR